MISILIPVFNKDVRNLVSVLASQIRQHHYPFEIIILDDGSAETVRELNRHLTSFPFVTYSEASANMGRIASRRKLASLAGHHWLLFLDDDSVVDSQHFLERYLECIGSTSAIVCGGRKYQSQAPACEYILHWKYGTAREHRWTAQENNLKGFQSNNFVIHSSIFAAISFPDTFRSYGHEDTWMGIVLQDLSCTIIHLDNPVIHGSLENASAFIEKTKLALHNLATLKHSAGEKKLADHVLLYRTWTRLQNFHLTGLVQAVCRLFRRAIERNLHSCHPNLFLFDLFRLDYFTTISR